MKILRVFVRENNIQYVKFFQKVPVKKIIQYVKSLRKVCVKISYCPWNFLENCAWKIVSLREKSQKKVKKRFHALLLFSRRKKKHWFSAMADKILKQLFLVWENLRWIHSMKFSFWGHNVLKSVSCTSFSVIDWNIFQDRVPSDRIFHRVYSKEFFGSWDCLLKKCFVYRKKTCSYENWTQPPAYDTQI